MMVKTDVNAITGGCQCGAVRYKIESLGRASICHCRMCQKAFGGFFAPLVSVNNIEWTKGERSIFHSSNRNWRGFCKDCGTPLTYEFEGGVEVSIGSLDNPDLAPPTVQVNVNSKLHLIDTLFDQPEVSPMQVTSDNEWNTGVVSNQHPDFDT